MVSQHFTDFFLHFAVNTPINLKVGLEVPKAFGKLQKKFF